MVAFIFFVVGFFIGFRAPSSNYRAGVGTPSRRPGEKPDDALKLMTGLMFGAVAAVIGFVLSAVI